ncbi:hypothetical protein [Enterobacter sp. PTB]|uniref:hypothetical protein n=1 Tax=Enterobacter sp. PTB TaxID=3143437 RepID=UPI003DA83667
MPGIYKLGFVKIKNSQMLGGMWYKGLYILITSLNALLMIKILPPKELGVWYIFMTLQTLIFTLNNSLVPNISRQYTLGNHKNGLDFCCNTFHHETKRIFGILVLLVFVLCGVLTVTYLQSVLSIFEPNNRLILAAWIFIVISLCMEVYFSSYDCAFNGMGDFKTVNKVNFVSKLFLFLSSVVLVFGQFHGEYGVFYFCVLYFISNLIKRVLISNTFRHDFKNKEIDELSDTKIYFNEAFKIIIKLSFLSLVSSVGGSFIVRGGMFILPYYVSLEDVGSYGITYQLFEIGFNLLFTAAIIKTPHWIQLFRESSLRSLSKSYRKLKFVCLLLMLFGGVFISILGQPLLHLFAVKTPLLSSYDCLFFTLVFILQLNHSISGQLLTIQNKIPFALASFLTGILVISFSMITIPFYGVVGAIASIFVGQAIYNNWKWPLEARRLITNA